MENIQNLNYAALSNGETYAYRDHGNSTQTIVFIHSNQTSSFYFETIFPKFEALFRLVAPDLRGYGHSTNYNPATSIDELVDDIKLFVDHLKLDKFALLGWSIGGGVAMKFAARYPSYIKQLILLHSIGVKGLAVNLPDEHGNPTDVRAKSMDEVFLVPKVQEVEKAFKEGDKQKVETRLLERFFNGKAKLPKERLDLYVDETLKQKSYFFSSQMLNSFNISEEVNGVTEGTGEIKKITCSTLLIYGGKDVNCPVEEGEKTTKLLGDKATFKVFENCGHCAFEDYPEEFVDTVVQFLSQ